MNTVATLPISGNTKVVVIIADPIAHVQTPQLLNALFQQAGYDAVCVPMHVAAEDLAGCLAALKTIRSISGAVITVPHKMATAQLCQHPGPQAQVMGAVNAIHFNAEREVVGEMFDGTGFVQGLIHSGVAVNAALSVYLAGAGGVARGIAFALLASGVRQLQVYNRTTASAEQLVAALQAYAPEAEVRLASSQPEGVDLCVNATSAGMLGLEAQLPFALEGVGANACVAEVVMQPEQTRLLQQAAAKGMKTVTGKQMLLAQVAQLAAFTLNEPALAAVKLEG
ncbi:MAG: shikimate dehydrogenase [Neisseriaceae bacterium]|nr:shikimate dehydrogenase [Neisseriaceae bacterium]